MPKLHRHLAKTPWLLAIGLLLAVSSCAAGSWIVVTPSVEVFLVPDAHDIQVSSTGLGDWQISYMTAGRPYAWYHSLARTLKGRQWILRNPARPDLAGFSYDPIRPLRFEISYGWLLWDEAVLYPDHNNPYRVTIQLRRQMVLARWYPPPSGGIRSSPIQHNSVAVYGAHPS